MKAIIELKFIIELKAFIIDSFILGQIYVYFK